MKDAMKPKSLIEKGASLLDVITSGSGSGGERSLFSWLAEDRKGLLLLCIHLI